MHAQHFKTPQYADDQLREAIQSFNAAVTASFAQEDEAEKERAAAEQIISSKDGDTDAALEAMEAAGKKKRRVVIERTRLLPAIPDIAVKWNACRSAEIAKYVRLADERRQYLTDLCQRESLQPVEKVLNCCAVLAQHLQTSRTMDAPHFEPMQQWADDVSAAASEAAGFAMTSPNITRRGRVGGAAPA